MNIDGTTGNDTLNGTATADTINGLAGNDVLNGLDSDDLLDGGDGIDQLFGGDGDDIFVQTTDLIYPEIFSGGAGIDTLRLQISVTPLETTTGQALSFYSFTQATFSSIERLEFASTAGNLMMGVFSVSQIAAGLFSGGVSGGAGTDTLRVYLTTAGDYTVPSINLTNWSSDDIVSLVVTGAGNFTLRAAASHPGIQSLTGSLGSDLLIGGDGNEGLYGGSGGVDILHGGGGDDNLFVIRDNTNFYVNSGSIFDGGSGTDTLFFRGQGNGSILFNGLMQSIEKVVLQPGTVPGAVANLPSQFPTNIQITSASGFSLTETEVSGTGNIGYTIEPGDAFDGSGIGFAAGSNVMFSIYGNDESNVIKGTAKNDYIDGGLGNDTLTGGAGADTFAISEFGQKTITDFTVGVDKLEVHAFSSFKMLRPFLSQVGNDVVFSIIYGGAPQTVTVKNVALADLTADSFTFVPREGITEGTESADTLIGTSFVTVEGFGGNDVIFSGTGTGNMSGGAGDDILVLNNALSFFNPYAPTVTLDGGSGTDTLRIQSFDNPSSVGAGPISSVNLSTAQIISIERIAFAQAAGERLQVLFTAEQASTSLTNVSVTGGTAADSVVFLAVGAGGDFSMPNLTRINWSTDLSPTTDPSNVLNSDAFILVAAGSGNFTLRASTVHWGIEVLQGSTGNDTLIGGGGVDNLNGGTAGADKLYGFGGTDFLNVGSGDNADDLFDGGNGIDYLTVSGIVNFQGTLVSMEGINLLPFLPAAPDMPGSGRAEASLTMSADTARQFGANALLRGAGHVDITLAQSDSLNLSGWTFETTPIDVSVAGSSGADVLKGTSHGDQISGNDGSDVIDGNAGDDALSGGNGDDVLIGGAGDDTLAGGAGSDTASYLDAAAAVQVSLAIATAQVTGGAGTDIVTGIENLTGSAFNDMLTGSSGANLIEGGAGDDMLDGGAGTDTASYAGATSAVTVALSLSAPQATGGAGVDKLTGFENLIGSAFGDSLTGDADANAIFGDAGNDTLAGGGADDVLYAQDGDDTVFGETGADTLLGGIGNDTLYGQDGNDILQGNEGSDTLVAGAGNDALYGQDGADVLWGEAGEDMLAGGTGDDLLYGQDGADILFGEGGNDSMQGGIGNDTLYGQDGNDILQGGDGEDTLVGGGGNDALYGDAGNDILFGEAGNDSFAGGAGNDLIYGQDGDDTLFGQDGEDLLLGNDGADMLAGGNGNDALYGNDGADTVFGEDGADNLFGGTGNDTLYGQGDNDVLQGEAGQDVLNGGAGNDFLIGGADGDQLIGGAGGDAFSFTSANDAPDAIYDFNRNEGDWLGFQASAFGVAAGTHLVQGTNFLYGAGVTSVAATATFYFDTNTRALWFDPDGTGAQAAHVEAFMLNTPVLTASDFYFI